MISCKHVTKTYRGTTALNRLSCNIHENTITGLIGRNAAGKTTLLKILTGMIKESSGEVEVFSKHPFNNLFVSANSILVDDQMSFANSISLYELLQQAGRFYKNWDMDLALRLFDYFSFQPNAIHEGLSKGRKSTFNMIIGLASRCPLTIFDEPTTGMDAVVRNDFYRALLKDYIAHPRTIIISSHHLDEMEHLLEHVLVIKKGKELLHIPMEDLKEYAIGLEGKTAVLKEWLGDQPVLTKRTASDYAYIAVKNDFDTEQLEQVKQQGVKVSPVSANDVCMYLTKGQKGGIDDVFRQR
ncbi:ABC transporter ATP-binding protein [Ornithinibacillus gellani]|uniref:ATP-binding cassette domain-containing protein n=1 Tax=Ornithinibacillus gellani TaxID=2293253 RepID=UPI000F46B37C|nr:ABC transporter ATP-binding protein [Ornithinibacillus gellani]TQS71019.1 ABC transporter ATP-binding protein [Ornithinibacillus gellani]